MKRYRLVISTAMVSTIALACGVGSGSSTTFESGETGQNDETGDPSAEGTTTGDTNSGTSGIKLDISVPEETEGPPSECEVPADELDAVPPCGWRPPPPDDAFNPETQWMWSGPGAENESIVIPLVANLTDDNDDGAIDLCDTPDVVVLHYALLDGPAKITVLDGASGTVHYVIDSELNNAVTPALGDIDGDGLVEIVAASHETAGLIAFNHDGTLAWGPTSAVFSQLAAPAIALADLDNDGDVEILADTFVADHEGQELWAVQSGDWSWAPTAADLDDDGDLEVIYGSGAWHHDGTEIFSNAQPPGFPQVANLDGDEQPEIMHTTFTGMAILEADGTKVLGGLQPTGDNAVSAYLRPATIHDFDGDGDADIAMSSLNHYSVFEYEPNVPDITVTWMNDVFDVTGIAAGTAFDFLGDGVAEAMYADETTFYVYDGGDGNVLLSGERTSRTLIEYPIVVDVDNDEAAEILVVSNEGLEDNTDAPTLQVIKNANNRWVPTRRIWNQHTYHVTNVREDGTIPDFEPPHWKTLNTFRTNAQIEGGGVCQPEG